MLIQSCNSILIFN